MISKINRNNYINYIKENKAEFTIKILLFILFVFLLAIRNYTLEFYYLPIIFFIIIFIFTQVFDYDVKYSFVFTLALFIINIFLIIFKKIGLAGYFENYTYAFLFIIFISIFFDAIREKTKRINKFKIYRYVFISIFALVILISIVFVLSNTIRTTNFGYTIINYLNDNIKGAKKNTNYSKIEKVTYGSETLDEQIVINIDNPIENSKVNGVFQITGSSIEKNATKSNGIDRIEFFLDGKPGNGKYLGYYEIPHYEANKLTIDFIKNEYFSILKRPPFEQELNYWAINLEYKIISYQEFIGFLFNSREYKNIYNKELNAGKYVQLVYQGILLREPKMDEYYYWVNQLDYKSIGKYGFLTTLANNSEYKKKVADYYQLVKINEVKPVSYGKDTGKEYGKQFYLSGFIFNCDSTKLSNGSHTIYIYAHSPLFGWDYKILNFTIENK